MSLPFALASHTGMLRENNEDHALALSELGLFIIADGMGGHAAGEVASALAVDRLAAVYTGQPAPRLIRDEGPVLAQGVFEANAAVLHEAEVRDLRGMGTTLTALKFRGRSAVLAHVGDTRAYSLHKGRIRQLTADHTLVGMLVRNKRITPEDAFVHPERNILTQAVGTDGPIDPQVVQTRIPRGARLLMSSDGLHDVVRGHEIVDLASNADLEAAVGGLIDRANQLGGPDNITAILIQT